MYTTSKQAELATLLLLKRYSCETFQELYKISSLEYATSHFDITTVKLIVWRLLDEAAERGADLTDILKAITVGATKCTSRPEIELVSKIRREHLNGKGE